MTVEQILAETQNWPVERVEELVTRLNHALEPASVDPEIDIAWQAEVRRRLVEIDNGSVELRDGEAVSERVRKIVGR